MNFKTIICDQGSREWHKARAGIPTASMFRVARSRVGGLDAKQRAYVNAILTGMGELEARELAGYKAAPKSEAVARALEGKPVGEPSSEALNYAFRLAVERISGEPLDEGFETWQMQRGHELEPYARHEHNIAEGIIVERAGFITTLDGRFGASADGFFTQAGQRKGSEYKCLVSPEKLRDVLVDNDISYYLDQVQGCLWISGLQEWHFGLYCPALEFIDRQFDLTVVERDDAYIQALESDLNQFSALVDKAEHALRRSPARRVLRAAANAATFIQAA